MFMLRSRFFLVSHQQRSLIEVDLRRHWIVPLDIHRLLARINHIDRRHNGRSRRILILTSSFHLSDNMFYDLSNCYFILFIYNFVNQK